MAVSRALARWELQPDDLTWAAGEAGDGIYAFFDNDHELDKHYQEEGRRRVRFFLHSGEVLVDLRRPAIIAEIAAYARSIGSGIRVTHETMERAYWSLTWYYETRIPHAAGYIVPHITPTTRSAQVVIKKREAIELCESVTAP